MIYFFDSYALIEVYKGNKNYEKYKKAKVVTSFLHVYEVYYHLKKVKEEADEFFRLLQSFCIDLEFEWIPKAVDFRLEHKNKDLSYSDCLGYVIAKDLNIKFLTGDNQFKNLPNVKFVK